MNALQLIANDAFITTNKALIKQFGLIEANIIGLFASIAQFNNSQYPENEGWFYATYERLNEELGLSQYVASKPIEKLIEAGILMDKKQGVPCRRFFKFNEEKLLNCLLSRNLITGNKETQQLGSEKVDTKEENNYITSDSQTSLPAQEKLGRNNKPNNKPYEKPNLGKVLSSERVWTPNILISELNNNAIEFLKKHAPKHEKYFLAETYLNYKNGKEMPDDIVGAFLGWARKFAGGKDGAASKKELAAYVPLPSESLEVTKIRSDIKQRICWQNHNVPTDYFLYFEGKKIREEDGIFTITVSNPKALKYEEALKNIVKIEVK